MKSPFHPNLTRRCAWIAGGIAGAAMLAGCLVLPVDYYQLGSRHNLYPNTQTNLQVGITAKEDVFLTLGEPDYVSDDGQRVAYAWKKVKLIWVVLAGNGGGGEISKSYFLTLTFDDSNHVSRVELQDKWASDP